MVVNNMNPSTAIDLIEGVEAGHTDEILEAWQYLVDTGIVWQLQGSYGRAAMNMIENGDISNISLDNRG